MFKAEWTAVVSTVQGDRVLRSRRVAATAFAAAELSWQDIAKQVSLLPLSAESHRTMLNFYCNVEQLPTSERQSASRFQAMADRCERANEIKDVVSSQEEAGFGRGQRLPSEVVEVIPEVGHE